MRWHRIWIHSWLLLLGRIRRGSRWHGTLTLTGTISLRVVEAVKIWVVGWMRNAHRQSLSVFVPTGVERRVSVTSISWAIINTHNIMSGVIKGIWLRVFRTFDDTLGLNNFGSNWLDVIRTAGMGEGVCLGVVAFVRSIFGLLS